MYGTSKSGSRVAGKKYFNGKTFFVIDHTNAAVYTDQRYTYPDYVVMIFQGSKTFSVQPKIELYR